MDITNLRYEAGELKKKVIDAHADVLNRANVGKDAIINSSEASFIAMEELKEIIKLADTNAEYYTQLSNSAKEQLKMFEDVFGAVGRLEEAKDTFRTYVGKCIECDRELYTDCSYHEEEPGNFICPSCWENVTNSGGQYY